MSAQSLIRHAVRTARRRLGRFISSATEATFFFWWVPSQLPLFVRALATWQARENTNTQRAAISLQAVASLYINLDRRTDRKNAVEAEIRRVGLAPRRHPATSHHNGSLGCALSHIEALQEIAKSGDRVAIIFEDDVSFLAKPHVVQELINEFVNTEHLDVLCLAFRLRAPRLPVSPNLAISNRIQTTACYVVKREAIGSLLKSFGESANLLEAGEPPSKAAIDVRWKSVQTKSLTFCVPRFPVARQLVSYSDVANKIKDYGP